MSGEECVTVYTSSVSSNMSKKKEQQRIIDILTGKGIKMKIVDISSDETEKDNMRKIVGNQAALPPQICCGQKYIGDSTAFEEAVEDGTLEDFLKGPKGQ